MVNSSSLTKIPGEFLPSPYQIDSVHLGLPLSGLGEIWMRMMTMLRLELQLERVSEFWIPSVKLDQPLENSPQFSESRKEMQPFLSILFCFNIKL